jgi:hypothetical protein
MVEWSDIRREYWNLISNLRILLLPEIDSLQLTESRRISFFLNDYWRTAG